MELFGLASHETLCERPAGASARWQAPTGAMEVQGRAHLSDGQQTFGGPGQWLRILPVLPASVPWPGQHARPFPGPPRCTIIHLTPSFLPLRGFSGVTEGGEIGRPPVLGLHALRAAERACQSWAA